MAKCNIVVKPRKGDRDDYLLLFRISITIGFIANFVT